jgi:hypothetical protein
LSKPVIWKVQVSLNKLSVCKVNCGNLTSNFTQGYLACKIQALTPAPGGFDMQFIKHHSGPKTKKASCRSALLISVALFLIAGCAAQGAKRVPADRFDYNAAIAKSTREQMLLNFAAAQAGWPIDIFMRIGIQRLGLVENMSFGEVPDSGYIDFKAQFASDLKRLKRFERMTNLIFILSDQEIIEVQQIEENGKTESYLMISENIPDELRPAIDELRRLIGLSNRNRFRITDRVTNLKDYEISIQTRSVMAMMEFMARGVEVPFEHLKDGWVIDYGLQNREGQVAKGLIPFRMHSKKSRPQNVFASVRFNDYWFYIDHADISSKRA